MSNPEPQPDPEPDGDADDQPNPHGPVTTSNVAPVLLPPRVV